MFDRIRVYATSRYVFFDSYGWPVELTTGHGIRNLFRLLFLTRKVRLGWWDGYRMQNKEDQCKA